MKRPSIQEPNWAETQFDKLQLGDRRRNNRAVKMASLMLENPAASIPAQMDNWSDTKGAYRLLNSKEVTHEALQKEHWNNVQLQAALSEKTILFIQDKSELNFNTKKETTGLGPIGNHKNSGLFVQSIIAVEFDVKPTTLLGLAYQKGWARIEQPSLKLVARKSGPDHPTEADYWIESLTAIARPATTKARWVAVGDRENDIYKFIRFCQKTNWNFLVRARSHRQVITEDEKVVKLADFARSLPSQANKTIALRARPGSPAREAHLSVAWGTVSMKAPKNYPAEYSDERTKITCLRVWEEGSDLEWFLITNLEIKNKEDALEMVSWYEARWIIEEYHKCLKTGCAIEDSQLQTAHGLLSLLGFLGIIATNLLATKYLAKQVPTAKAIDHHPLLHVQVLASRFDLSVDDMTCHQYWRSIARLGGFLGRKSDGDPGWQTLWKGHLKFQDMIEGAECWKRCG